MNNHMTSKGKSLIYLGCVNGMIQVGFQVALSMVPFSLDSYKIVAQLREIVDVACFGLYLGLLVVALVMYFKDKENSANVSVYKASLFYSILYVIGVRGLAPLLLPVTMANYALKNRKAKILDGGMMTSDTTLIAFTFITCFVTIGGFVLLTSGVLH